MNLSKGSNCKSQVVMPDLKYGDNVSRHLLSLLRKLKTLFELSHFDLSQVIISGDKDASLKLSICCRQPILLHQSLICKMPILGLAMLAGTTEKAKVGTTGINATSTKRKILPCGQEAWSRTRYRSTSLQATQAAKPQFSDYTSALSRFALLISPPIPSNA